MKAVSIIIISFLSFTNARHFTPLRQFDDSRLLIKSSKVRGGSSSSFRIPPRSTQQGIPSQQQQQQQKQLYGNNPRDAHEEEASTKEMIDAFLTRDSRNSFIARVYSILGAQLLVTAISCTLFGLNPLLSNLTQLRGRNGQPSPLAFIPLLGMVASTIAWFRVSFSPQARRKAPNKWWWLSIFTLGEAISVGFVTSIYRFRTVVLAMGATALSAGSISLYTLLQTNPNRDLSQIGASLSSWTVILLSYSMVGLLQHTGVLPANFIPFNDMIYSALSSCLFAAFLAYHTKLIVGNKHSKYRMNEQDYVYGAMALYSDIVGIFLNILRIIGDEKDRK